MLTDALGALVKESNVENITLEFVLTLKKHKKCYFHFNFFFLVSLTSASEGIFNYVEEFEIYKRYVFFESCSETPTNNLPPMPNQLLEVVLILVVVFIVEFY